MAEIEFGGTSYTKVTKGGLGGKFVIPSHIKTVKHILPTIDIRLPKDKEVLLKQHSKSHSKRHMEYMRQQILMGLTFKQAHQRAAQFIGR